MKEASAIGNPAGIGGGAGVGGRTAYDPVFFALRLANPCVEFLVLLQLMAQLINSALKQVTQVLGGVMVLIIILHHHIQTQIAWIQTFGN